MVGSTYLYKSWLIRRPNLMRTKAHQFLLPISLQIMGYKAINGNACSYLRFLGTLYSFPPLNGTIGSSKKNELKKRTQENSKESGGSQLFVLSISKSDNLDANKFGKSTTPQKYWLPDTRSQAILERSTKYLTTYFSPIQTAKVNSKLSESKEVKVHAQRMF